MNVGERILVQLRSRILDGTYPAGSVVTEIATAEDLGVSRTPVRFAFRILEKEGFLEPSGARGYAVREVTQADMNHALKLRGLLEGEAARLLAERGLHTSVERDLTDCLKEEGRLFAGPGVPADLLSTYQQLNTRFHERIVTACGSKQLEASIRQVRHVPTGIRAIGIRSNNPPSRTSETEFLRLFIGHVQHCVILHAIRQGDGPRAEAVMREHSNVRIDYTDILAELVAHGGTIIGAALVKKARKE